MGSLSGHRVAALIEQATVDAYNESEQTTGFFTMFEDHLALPFVTQMLGVLVTVEAVDLTQDERIMVICSRGEHRQRVPILDLPLPDPAPGGAEWIEAYRAWSTGS
jgi:hypothetical protein